uniref:Cytochrome P450 n=1 Tax=Agasicles hygrophila TaxID=715812 RepID=A0A3Q8APU7_9CUCU|nr:cytochrome P450 [Agasicles hygrophila]
MLIIAAVVVLLIFLCLPRFLEWYKFCQILDKIPGPKDYPIIGNWTETKINPESLFNYDRQLITEFYPICRIKFFYQYLIKIVCPEDMEAILSNVAHNNKNKFYRFMTDWLGTGLLISKDKKWHNRRKLLTPAFHFTILPQFVDIFNSGTQRLTEYFENNCHKEYIDIIHPVTNFALESMGESAMGVNISSNNTEWYRNAIHSCGRLLQERLVKPWLHSDFIYSMTQSYQTMHKNINVLHEFTKKLITERKQYWNDIDKNSSVSYSKQKRLALLDLMLKMSETEGQIDDEGIREEVDTFMFEGHDTTAIAVCTILLTLASEPEYQEEIYKEIISVLGESDRNPTYNDLCEMKFMERCIKECLRLYPSVPIIGRVIGETFVSHSGYTIPKGTQVFIYIYDMHRNPNIWKNPEKFDPDRFLPENTVNRNPFTFLPFSAGGRNCIGQKFAMLELKAVLCGILRKFSLEPFDTRSDLKFKTDIILRPINKEIRIKFLPRTEQKKSLNSLI